MSDIDQYLPEFVTHLNDDHADVVTMLYAAAQRQQSSRSVELLNDDSATVVSLSRSGAEVAHPQNGSFSLAFAEAAGNFNELVASLLAEVATTRRAFGIDALTSMEYEQSTYTKVPLWRCSVVSRNYPTPGTIQVTLGGGDLDTYRPSAPDDFHYVLSPRPPSTTLDLGDPFRIDSLEEMGDAGPIGVTYTVRRFDAVHKTIDLVVVRHPAQLDHDEGANVIVNGCTWAELAPIGAPVALWGPRSTFHLPDGCVRIVLVVDDTALPAAASIVEWVTSNYPSVAVNVIAEVADEAERVELPNARSVLWLYRDGRAPGTTQLLGPALKALCDADVDPSDERIYFFGGGESKVMTQLRRFLRSDLGFPRPQVSMTGYWRATTREPNTGNPDGA